MNIYLVTGAALLVYLIFVWFLGNLLHLHGRDIWVLRIGLGVIGIIGAGVFLWFKRREQKLAAEKERATSAALKKKLRSYTETIGALQAAAESALTSGVTRSAGFPFQQHGLSAGE